MKAGWNISPIVLLTALAMLSGCSEKPSSEVAAAGGSHSNLLIEPKLAVGPIRVGMTTQQVLAQLGQPQRRTSNSLEYKQLGLAIMPNPEGRVQVVMCGDVTGINGPFAKAFKGRTKEGIGMYSTREEVTRVYGEPTRSEKMRGGLESLQYESLGMTFTLEAGKVHHMIVRLREDEPMDRTVTLEPAPQTTEK